MQTNIHSGLLLPIMGITCLTRQFVLGSFFDVFLGDFRSTWGRQERIIWDPVFFRILGCQKCCFHEIRRSNITAFRRSLHQILCAAFLGPPCPPLPQPRSDQTTSVIIRADFNIFNFRKLASPFPSLQGTFQKHFQLPNLPPLFQTFRHHQGHQGPQGPRFRQIFGLQIAPQWSHRHRD